MENLDYEMNTKKTAKAEDWEIAEILVDLMGGVGYTSDYEPTAQVIIGYADELRDRGSYDEVWKSDFKAEVLDELKKAIDADENLLWPQVSLELQTTVVDRIMEAFLHDADWSDDDPFQNGEDDEDEDF